MPIKSLVENQHNKADFSIGRDVELSFCSDTCLLRELDDRSRVVRTGQTDATALTVLLQQDRLLVPLAGARRGDVHVLGSQSGHGSARSNWEKLAGRRHPALMPVYRVCDCMAETQILGGDEFEDAATTPAWKKARAMVGKQGSARLKGQPVAFDQWRTWMGELAQGLAELEKLGLAHGDPYPFNAIQDGRNATWVDFGHMTDDPEQRLKDAWAFVLFTVLHTLGKTSSYSPLLLKNLATALAQAEQPERFERIQDALLQSYSDLIPMNDTRVPELLFIQAITEQSPTAFKDPVVPELLLKSSVQYFSAFLHHIQRGNQYSMAFQVEQQRHRFHEEEMLRLTVPKAEYLNQLDKKDKQHAAALRAQEENIAQQMMPRSEHQSRLDAQRDDQLQLTIQKNEQIAHLNETVAGLNAQLASLDQLLAQKEGQHSAALQVEQQRHRFHEEEMLRLMVPNAEYSTRLEALRESQQEIVAAKNEQIAKLTQAMAGLDAQLANLNQISLQKEEQNSNLRRVVAEHDRHSGALRHELDTLFKRHEQVLHSRSWRLTRPLRGAARFYKYGTNYPEGRQILYRIAAKIGRKFPFPLAIKSRVKAALIAKPQPVALDERIDHVPALHQLSFPSGEANQHSYLMDAGRCGLIEGLVSVILPVYNQADLIAESIDSVLNQTYQNFELIIINDGSKDDVESVLGRYLDHPKVRCYTQENQRLPKALSNGFDYARGEFRTWTSADNIMEPRMLEVLISKLREEPATAMVYADYYAIDDRGALLQDLAWRRHNRPDPSSGEIRLPRTTEKLNIVQDNFIGPCFMYRGWVGSCIGDYDTQLGIEDYDYWMRINAFFRIQHAENESPLYRYRVHDNTLSAQAHEHKILDKVQLLMNYEKERADYYKLPLAYATDDNGSEWLKSNGISSGEIFSFEENHPDNAILVLSGEEAEKNISRLKNTQKPIAIILEKTYTRYHKLLPLLDKDQCIALARDVVSAERIRLISNCPTFDIQSGIVLTALQAFAKNWLFTRATRGHDEIRRAAPSSIHPVYSGHILLQVDSFTQGGMENVVIDLAISLQSQGYRVTIANLGKSGDAALKAKELGLQIVSFTAAPNEDYLSWLRQNEVDLVNAHYSTYGAPVCHAAGIPFIQTVHNSYVWLDQAHIAIYREADRHTTQYICVSMTAARYADVALELDVGKMRVVPNGIDPNTIDAAHFSENREELRKIWGINADTPVFINVASIMATKAQLPLVKAFSKVVKQIPEARLVLLGTVMEAAYHNAIKSAARALGLEKNVIFAGYERNVARYYHAADVFVLPSYWEGWSLSLGEAMANGLACVITDVGSAYEFEGDGKVEVVAPPFGDITNLNYRNLGDFVYGEDASFDNRIADAMIKLANHRRSAPDFSIANRIDREIAYKTYADLFNDVIRQGTP